MNNQNTITLDSVGVSSSNRDIVAYSRIEERIGRRCEDPRTLA